MVVQAPTKMRWGDIEDSDEEFLPPVEKKKEPSFGILGRNDSAGNDNRGDDSRGGFRDGKADLYRNTSGTSSASSNFDARDTRGGWNRKQNEKHGGNRNRDGKGRDRAARDRASDGNRDAARGGDVGVVDGGATVLNANAKISGDDGRQESWYTESGVSRKSRNRDRNGGKGDDFHRDRNGGKGDDFHRDRKGNRYGKTRWDRTDTIWSSVASGGSPSSKDCNWRTGNTTTTNANLPCGAGAGERTTIYLASQTFDTSTSNASNANSGSGNDVSNANSGSSGYVNSGANSTSFSVSGSTDIFISKKNLFGDDLPAKNISAKKNNSELPVKVVGFSKPGFGKISTNDAAPVVPQWTIKKREEPLLDDKKETTEKSGEKKETTETKAALTSAVIKAKIRIKTASISTEKRRMVWKDSLTEEITDDLNKDDSDGRFDKSEKVDKIDWKSGNDWKSESYWPSREKKPKKRKNKWDWQEKWDREKGICKDSGSTESKKSESKKSVTIEESCPSATERNTVTSSWKTVETSSSSKGHSKKTDSKSTEEGSNTTNSASNTASSNTNTASNTTNVSKNGQKGRKKTNNNQYDGEGKWKKTNNNQYDGEGKWKKTNNNQYDGEGKWKKPGWKVKV